MTETQTPIRVLCVFGRLDRGGAETMCMELYRHIDRQKIQFDFIKHTSDKCAFDDEILALGGRIYEAPPYKVYNHVLYCNWWKRHLSDHPEHRIIHGHYFTISSVFFKVSKKMGRITVGHSHCAKSMNSKQRDKSIIKRLKTKVHSFFLKKVEHRADHCLACSKEAGKWVFPHKEPIILNNAIDAAKFVFSPETRSDVRKELGINANDLLVGTVGRFNEPKNPYGIVDIFKSLSLKELNARMLWVGDGEMRVEIKQRISQENLTSSVIMTGVRKDVERMLQAMDVFILPSLWEGLPVSLIEAQAAGLPCLCSDTVSREAAVTELCDFLPLPQPELWAKKILEVSKRERVDTSEQIIKSGYDIKTTSKWLEDFYIKCSDN